MPPLAKRARDNRDDDDDDDAEKWREYERRMKADEGGKRRKDRPGGWSDGLFWSIWAAVVLYTLRAAWLFNGEWARCDSYEQRASVGAGWATSLIMVYGFGFLMLLADEMNRRRLASRAGVAA